MQNTKTLSVLATMLALVFCLVELAPVVAQATFTGNVEADFPEGLSVRVCTDDPFKLLVPGTNKSSGWDIKEVRLRYDAVSDTLYVGLNSYGWIGDGDSNGDEGSAEPGLGPDYSDLGGGECVSVYFDLNQDGYWDVIAGNPDYLEYDGGDGFIVALYEDSHQLREKRFGNGYTTELSAHRRKDLLMWGPDFEFAIVNFTGLPGQDPPKCLDFNIGAFMGNVHDPIGEDHLKGCNVSLPISIPPVGGTALPPNKLALVAPLALLVCSAAVVTLLVLRKRRQA